MEDWLKVMLIAMYTVRHTVRREQQFQAWCADISMSS